MSRLGSLPGVCIRGVISGEINPSTGVAFVRLPHTSSPTPVPVKMPLGWLGSRGQCSGGYPERGTPVIVTMSQGNEYVFVSYGQNDNNTRTYESDGRRRVASKMKPGRWITCVENDVSLLVDPKEGVSIGDSIQYLRSDPVVKTKGAPAGIISSKTSQEMHFTEAHRSITGAVKRDTRANDSRGAAGSALTGHAYETTLSTIGLDPKTFTSVSTAATRNPLLNESRSMYYEFIDSFRFTNDSEEARLYGGEDTSGIKPFQRKATRTDTMSLTLDQPNYLLETIIGTVVDIYGNILDLNRDVLPNGQIDSLSLTKSEDDLDTTFLRLREQLRKSIAYHFEINARKSGLEDSLVDYNDFDTNGLPTDYGRARSRFHFDVDKEGQFKLNVPSSSEVGNVGLAVRHENFSNLLGAENDKDRNSFIRPASRTSTSVDIKLDAFGGTAGLGSEGIELISNEESLKAFAAPPNRLSGGDPIRLNTPYHVIQDLNILHTLEGPYSDATGTGGFNDSLLNDVPPPITSPSEESESPVVSPQIIVSGEGANAGGRSGTINMDGMLSLSLGANTIDRQSLWLDCAGGIVAAIGRDKFQRSMVMQMDGDMLVQIGGPGISDDSRFQPPDYNNAGRDGVADIRVWNSGSLHTIRIDSQGITVHTPQRIDIVSEGEMRFKSVRSDMYFDAERMWFYAGNPDTARMVLRATEGGAGRSI